jgi:hypothetical protein
MSPNRYYEMPFPSIPALRFDARGVRRVEKMMAGDGRAVP